MFCDDVLQKSFVTTIKNRDVIQAASVLKCGKWESYINKLSIAIPPPSWNCVGKGNFVFTLNEYVNAFD